MDFGNALTNQKFETILKYLQLSDLDDEDQQILDFLAEL